jgi:hypothetical protein
MFSNNFLAVHFRNINPCFPSLMYIFIVGAKQDTENTGNYCTVMLNMASSGPAQRCHQQGKLSTFYDFLFRLGLAIAEFDRKYFNDSLCKLPDNCN